MRKRQWFVFQVFDGGRDLLDRPIWHWEVTLQYHTKAEVFKAYNRYSGHRKVREVFTLRQFVEAVGIQTARRVMEDNRGRILADNERYSEE
jgi:hypothetical protein